MEKYDSAEGMEKGGYGMLVRSINLNIAKIFQEYSDCLEKTKNAFLQHK